MATFNDIFIAYYNLYRGDGSTPAVTDPEWTIGLRLANNAIDTWVGNPGFMWNELFTRLQLASSGDKTIVANQTSYQAPSDMNRAGGFVKTSNATTGAYDLIRLYQPWEVQNLDSNTPAAYFTGDPNHGYTLNLQGSFINDQAGWSLDYVYYKNPTQMVDGTSIPEMYDTSFMVNNMLANRFRNSRNWPAYQTALRDAQNSLKNMEAHQNSGTNFNPFTLYDPSGSHVGVAFGS